MIPLPPVTLAETFRLIGTDITRMASFTNVGLLPLRWMYIVAHPSIVALAIHRIAHWAYRRRLRPLAWALSLVNQYVTGADIAPLSSFGRSCLIAHVNGTVICGRIGDNVTFFGAAGVGGGNGLADIGAGPGLPVIGDHVILGVRATVLGPVHIGEGSLIGAHSLVLNNVPPGKLVVTAGGRVIGNRDLAPDFEAISRSGRKARARG